MTSDGRGRAILPISFIPFTSRLESRLLHPPVFDRDDRIHNHAGTRVGALFLFFAGFIRNFVEANFMGFRSAIPIRRPLLRWASVAIVLLLTVPLLAQTAARIDGTVTDQTGAVIPNAKITALNVKTQVAKQATSNAQGLYLITPVDPGIYNILVEVTGFNKAVMNSVEVNVAGTYTADFKLIVGSATESVEVVANQVAVQTSDSAISRAITLKDIDTLPQLGRAPITLAVYQPGVQLDASDSSYSRINGQRQGSNNTTLDGIDVNDSVVPRLGLSMTANNTDSVGEFRIVTQGAKAEYGRNAGGQVEMITRSGTNRLHGNGFDYLRNTVLNANNFFNKNNPDRTKWSERPKFIQNIFGGSIGGPILKNKLFFFGNYQGTRTRQEVIRNRTALTSAARQGIFTYTDSTGALRTYDIVANDPRHIGVDPQMKKIFAMLPDCNNTDTGDKMNTCGFRFNVPANSYNDQFTVKGDYNITDRMKTFLRWSWQRNSSIDTTNGYEQTFPGQIPATQGGHRWGFSIGHDWTITNNIVNEVRVGHQSATTDFPKPARLAGPTIISNLFTDPVQAAYAQGRNSPVNDIIDNMTMTKGNHIFKWGGKLSYTRQWGYRDDGIWYNITTAASSANGNLPTVPSSAGIPSSQQTQYQRLYNDVLGRMDNIAHTFYSSDLQTWQPAGKTRNRAHHLNEYGFYAQDDWKIRRNLTLNIGLRWELFLPPTEENGQQATFVNAGSITPTNTATDLTIMRSKEWYNTDWNNLAPRVGFAWDVTGDGKTAVRGNYGVFYDRMIGATVSSADLNTPGFSQNGSSLVQTFTAAQLAAAGCAAPAGDVRINDCIPLPAAPGTGPTLTLPMPNIRDTSVVVFNPNLRTGYVHSFSLNVQREILKNTIVDVGYVGALGNKLLMDRDFNQLKIDGDFLSAFKEMQTFNTAGTLPSASNTLVKLFLPQTRSTAASYAPLAGQPCSAQPNPVLCASTQAVSALGASTFTNGNAGAAAVAIDRSTTYTGRYAGAGLPATYLRNYPQFNQMIVGTNDGRSYYHALQLSVRRYAGSFRMNANYTYGHSIDNTSVDGNGFTTTWNIDNFKPSLNRANGDYDHRHSFNGSVIYAMPVGNGKRFGANWPKWLDTMAGGWEVGSLIVLQDGDPFSVRSQRQTRHLSGNGTTTYTFANYTGNRHLGRVQYNADGSVWFFTPEAISSFGYPAAGEYGSSGRNAFRGPGYFNIDSSLVKRFKLIEGQAITFRAEAYNLLNHTNFSGFGTTITDSATFGKFSSTRAARVMQLTLRYDF